MYNIGQYRFNNTSFDDTDNIYYSTLAMEYTYLSTDSSALEDGISFLNYCGKTLNETFNNTECYYLRFQVKQRLDSQQNFYLKLRKSNSIQQESDIEQTIEEYKVPQGNGATYFQVIISPNSTYDQIVWDLKRSIIDYEALLGKRGGRLMEVTVESFVKLKDIFTSIFGEESKVKSLSKIGIQGPPLMLTCINRQQIRIGYNGIYEINNGTKITSISFVPRTINDYFIMDYEYQEEEEES